MSYALYRVLVFLTKPITLFLKGPNLCYFYLQLLNRNDYFNVWAMFQGALESGNFKSNNFLTYKNLWNMGVSKSGKYQNGTVGNQATSTEPQFAKYSSYANCVYDYVHRMKVRFPVYAAWADEKAPQFLDRGYLRLEFMDKYNTDMCAIMAVTGFYYPNDLSAQHDYTKAIGSYINSSFDQFLYNPYRGRFKFRLFLCFVFWCSFPLTIYYAVRLYRFLTRKRSTKVQTGKG